MNTSTTTLKLPQALKARIVPPAAATGKTPHAWMIDAFEAQAALAEMREALIAEGEASAAEPRPISIGCSISWCPNIRLRRAERRI